MKKRDYFAYIIASISAIVVVLSLILLWICYYGIIKTQTRPNNFKIPSNQRVLFISSHNYSYENVDLQIKGLGLIFNKKKINYDVEFMDAKNFPDKVHLENFYVSLKQKLFKSNPYNGVILSGDEALSFGLKYHEKLFPDIPIIYIDVTDRSLMNIAEHIKKFAGVKNPVYLKDTIDFAIKLNPKATSITVISDNTITGLALGKEFNKIKSFYNKFSINEINTSKITQKEFEDKIKTLPLDTIALYLSCENFSDTAIFSSANQADFIRMNCPVPVYKVTYGEFINGFFGGKVIDNEKIASDAAQMLVEVFAGKNIATVQDIYEEKYFWIFNNELLNKFKINKAKLPGNKIIASENSSVFFIIPTLIPTVFLLLGLLVLIGVCFYEFKNAQIRDNNLEEIQREFIFRSEHDTLTHLPNRHSARQILETLLNSKNKLSVLLIDLDNFKNFNDFYTHSCGDTILKTISQRFFNLMHDPVYYVSRFGGDEFLIIYKGGILTPESKDFKKVRDIFEEPVVFENKKLQVHCSIGIANVEDSIYSGDELIANADIAMSYSKKDGKNQFTFFDHTMKNEFQRNNEISKILDAAGEDDFEVVYQPQINVETNEVYGYEALVRFKDKTFPPSMFIPIAEENGAIIKIDRIVTEKVIHQMAEWKRKGLPLKKVSINYSYKQINDKDYVGWLEELMKTNGIDSQYIGIEITESLFIENQRQAKKIFDSFRDIGINLALDDFGTGYSSLSYLTYLPIETVKIDKSLIDNYLDSDNSSFIENIVLLVHSLNMKLVIEGVEYESQYKKLKKYGCDYVQGHLFSKPISASEVENWTVPKISI